MLINGELRLWQGPRQAVVSPIRLRNSAGILEPIALGSYPEGSEQDSDDALDAALSAYDNGRGAWLTMSVAERISCMQVFTKEMTYLYEAANVLLTRIAKWSALKSSGMRIA